MARIRSVKPEFCTSEQVVECSPTARLLFILMWMFCDDHGNHPASIKTLKMEVFPADDFTQAAMQGWMDELIKQGLIDQYEGPGDRRQYWHVTGWKHQKIEKPNQKYPPYPGQKSTTIHRTVAEQAPTIFAEESPTTRLPLDDSSPEDVDVDVEGKGVNLKTIARAAAFVDPPAPVDNFSTSDARAFDEAESKVKTGGNGQATDGGPAEEAVKAMTEAGLEHVSSKHPKLAAMLQQGYSVEELAAAAAEAVSRGKGLAYALATAEGRREDAVKLGRAHPVKSAGLTAEQAIEARAVAAGTWPARPGETWAQLEARTRAAEGAGPDG